MAEVIGGDILAVKWSNPNLGSGRFFPVANTDSTLDFGGFRGNDQAGVDGAARLMRVMNRTPWMAKLEVSDDPIQTEEFATASALASDPSETVWTIDHVSGATYSGNGSIMGKLELNANKATFTLNICGGGTLQKL